MRIQFAIVNRICLFLQFISRLIYFTIQLPGQESADLEDNSDESDDDGRDTEFGRSDRPTSDSRVGGQMILEAQPEINMKVPANHFDFGAILPMLSNLEEVYVCYKVCIDF